MFISSTTSNVSIFSGSTLCRQAIGSESIHIRTIWNNASGEWRKLRLTIRKTASTQHLCRDLFTLDLQSSCSSEALYTHYTRNKTQSNSVSLLRGNLSKWPIQKNLILGNCIGIRLQCHFASVWLIHIKLQLDAINRRKVFMHAQRLQR